MNVSADMPLFYIIFGITNLPEELRYKVSEIMIKKAGVSIAILSKVLNKR